MNILDRMEHLRHMLAYRVVWYRVHQCQYNYISLPNMPSKQRTLPLNRSLVLRLYALYLPLLLNLLQMMMLLSLWCYVVLISDLSLILLTHPEAIYSVRFNNNVNDTILPSMTAVYQQLKSVLILYENIQIVFGK